MFGSIALKLTTVMWSC